MFCTRYYWFDGALPAWPWVLGLLLAGCEAPPARPPVQRPATPPTTVATPAAPPATVPAPTPTAPEAAPAPAGNPGPPAYRVLPGNPIRYRRYVGWLGTRPVVLHLHVGSQYEGEGDAQLWGSYYDARSGAAGYFTDEKFHAHRRIRLRVSSATADATEYWLTRQPLGARLTGTVTVAGQPRRHFTLREDYRAATALVIRTARMCRPPLPYRRNPPTEAAPDTVRSCYRWRYVQLLGAASHPPALRRLLSGRPARVRARLRQLLEATEDLASSSDYLVRIDLNDYGLLSYSKAVSYDYFEASHPDNLFASFSCDLYTGRRITLASLLRPGREPALRRLALRHMNRRYRQEVTDWDDSPEAAADLLQGVDLEESFGLTPGGLLLNANIGPSVMGSTTVVIPYAALRPLLRPRTPLNRVLVARGLRPVR